MRNRSCWAYANGQNIYAYENKCDQGAICLCPGALNIIFKHLQGWLGENMGPRPFGSKEIDGLLVPPGKASTLLTDHRITD